jgi:hypothetical protein
MLFGKWMPMREITDPPGSAGPSGPSSTPPASGPAQPGQPQSSGEPVPAIAQHMGIDLSAIPEHERPATIERLKQMDGKFNTVLQEAAPWRKLGERLGGMTPEQIEMAIVQARQGAQIAEAIAQAMGQQQKPQQQPEDDLPPELQDNPIFRDPDFAYVRKAVEFLADKKAEARVQPLTQAQKAQEAQAQKDRDEAAFRKTEELMSGYLGQNADLGITQEQLRNALIRGVGLERIRQGNVTQLELKYAAMSVLGDDKYEEAIYNRRLAAARKAVDEKRPGPVVSPGGATGTPLKSDLSFDNPREVAAEASRRWEALQRARGQ